MGSGGTLGANWTRQRSAGGQRFSALSLTATQRVSARIHANITGWRTLEGGDGWGAQFLLSWFPGERENAGFGYQTGDTGSLGVLSAQSSLPSDAVTSAASAGSTAGCAAVKVDDRELARYLEETGALVRLGDGFVVGASGFDDACFNVQAIGAGGLLCPPVE